MAQTALQTQDDLDRTVELALAEVDGDTLQALRNLVLRQRELEIELSRTVRGPEAPSPGKGRSAHLDGSLFKRGCKAGRLLSPLDKSYARSPDPPGRSRAKAAAKLPDRAELSARFTTPSGGPGLADRRVG